MGGKKMHRTNLFCALGLAAPSALCLTLSGCVEIPAGTDNTVSEVLGINTQAGGNVDSDGSTPVTFDENGKVILFGTIDDDGDIDSYNLGACPAGTAYTMEFSQDSSLDAVAALFDSDSNLAMLNDNSYDLLQPTAPRINLTAHWTSDNLYLVIAGSPRGGGSGAYNVSVTRTFGSAPATASAVVVMDWNGASGVSVGGRPTVDIPAFQGSFIDPTFSGDTQALIDKTMAYVRQDFQGLNVTFYEDGEPGIPGDSHSTVYFGTYSAELLGLADSVDYYNGVADQQAIIFTDSFALFMALNPSVDEMAQTLANVASHEVGHLLGLNHTQDPTSIMDITATAYELMQDEAFHRSLMHQTIFPTGYQNAVLLLVNTVGGTADPSAARFIRSRDEALRTDPAEIQRANIGSFLVRKDFFYAQQCAP
jgi:hypothetical protein